MRIGISHIGIETSWVALAVGVTRCAVRAVRRVTAAAGAGWRSSTVVASCADGTHVDTETELRPTARTTGRKATLARWVLRIAVQTLVAVVVRIEHHVVDTLRCFLVGRPGRPHKRQSWSSIWRDGVEQR